MSYRVRYTKDARDDLKRLYEFLLKRDLHAARRARDAIGKAADMLREFPFSCRKAVDDNPFLRELVIPFGSGGYVALFEIEGEETVTILALRHQREDDYL
ncbi:MAG: type II toxin-antitoxin system RelE/ParE family toxin [Oxalobacter sp.]|nr:MAG: type II toxin-antitoxin system RelE/ParE family toxin [Oxalobacter sp.]